MHLKLDAEDSSWKREATSVDDWSNGVSLLVLSARKQPSSEGMLHWRYHVSEMLQIISQVAAMSQHIPGTQKLNTGRLTVSLAESICFRAAIKPVRTQYK